MPDGVANLVFGTGEDVGSLLVAHPDVDLIAFTGSREVGTSIWQTASVTPRDQRNLKKVICEMGGKNAMIIDTDADLDEAVLGILHSAFDFQGQKCSALSRLITVRDVHKRLVPRLIEAVSALKIGLPEQPNTDIGPVIDRDAFAKIQGYIELGKREHHLACQAQVPSGLEGYFISPAIFTGVEPNARLAQEEIFGPVLAVIQAKDLGQAIEIANHTPFALTGGFYSRSPQNIARVRSEFMVGNLYINRPITGAIVGRHPFGGFKMSGGGTKAGGDRLSAQFHVSPRRNGKHGTPRLRPRDGNRRRVEKRGRRSISKRRRAPSAPDFTRQISSGARARSDCGTNHPLDSVRPSSIAAGIACSFR